MEDIASRFRVRGKFKEDPLTSPCSSWAGRKTIRPFDNHVENSTCFGYAPHQSVASANN